MLLLVNPRASHHIHLAWLVTVFLCGLATMAMSAAFLDESVAYNYGGGYNRYHLDVYKLLVAASALTIIGTVTFLVFNTVGSLFKGLKNSLMVETVVFVVLLGLNLAGVARLSTSAYELHCSEKICKFGIATLVLACVSTILLIAFVIFLIVWSVVNRHGQEEPSVYKSNIKAHYVGGGIDIPSEAGKANIAPATPPI